MYLDRNDWNKTVQPKTIHSSNNHITTAFIQLRPPPQLCRSACLSVRFSASVRLSSLFDKLVWHKTGS